MKPCNYCYQCRFRRGASVTFVFNPVEREFFMDTKLTYIIVPHQQSIGTYQAIIIKSEDYRDLMFSGGINNGRGSYKKKIVNMNNIRFELQNGV